MKARPYSQIHLLLFLLTTFCFTKIALIKHIPLINDEAYTLAISKYFSLSYFDHPPLTMWISYVLHMFENIELYVFRIPFILFGVLTSFFLYKIGALVYSKKAGATSAILYFISPFFFLSGGMFIVPDASLNFSVAGATYIAIRLIFYKENSIYLWIALGILLAIAFLSKYQAYLFGLSLFVAFIIWNRDTLFEKNFYISLLISILGLAPVFFWNIENGFDSFNFHGSRISLGFDILHVFNSLFAQIFFLLPTTSFLIIISLIKNKNSFTEIEKFLVLLALPTIIVFNILIIISDNSFAHWSMVGWMLLILPASNFLFSIKTYIPLLISLKVLTVFVVVLAISSILIHAKTGFITEHYGDKVPYWDNTRELLDWEDITNILKKTLQEKELDSLATFHWYDSGQLTSAFRNKHLVGVIGPNGNHFKYIGLRKKNFTTILSVQLLHTNKKIDLLESVQEYNYDVINKIELPFFRGDKKYGIIRIFFVEKKN